MGTIVNHVLVSFCSDIDKKFGLSNQEVGERIEKYSHNELKEKKKLQVITPLKFEITHNH